MARARWWLVTALGIGVLGCDAAATREAACDAASCVQGSGASGDASHPGSRDAAAAPAEDSGNASDAVDGGSGDSGDTGEPGTQGSGTECDSDADCSLPASMAPCNAARCVQGECRVIDDDDGLPEDDGNACTEELCNAGAARHEPAPLGTSCNQDGGAVCDGDGACVECVHDSDCPGMDCTLGSCVPNCHDGIQNGTETHVDCGGTTSNMICPACPAACTDNWECDGVSAGGAGAGICYDGACVDDVHGCTVANSVDFLDMVSASQSAPITIDFGGGLGNSYAPRCIKVTMGTKVRFEGSFSSHALIGGLADGTEQPAATGPFTTVTDSGSSADFVMDDCAAYPYYCDDDGLSGMTGAVIVLLP